MQPSPIPSSSLMPPTPIPPEPFFTAIGMGLVGTGRTPGDARRDLMEKIKQAGEL